MVVEMVALKVSMLVDLMAASMVAKMAVSKDNSTVAKMAV